MIALARSNRAPPAGSRSTLCWRAVRRARTAARAARVEGERAPLPDCPGLYCCAASAARRCSSATAVAVAGWSSRSSSNAARSRQSLSISGCRRPVHRWRQRGAIRRWNSFPGQTSQTTHSRPRKRRARRFCRRRSHAVRAVFPRPACPLRLAWGPWQDPAGTVAASRVYRKLVICPKPCQRFDRVRHAT